VGKAKAKPVVWIEEGCIGCGLCAHYCPTVFQLNAVTDESRVRGAARCDGVTDGNAYRRSPLVEGLPATVREEVGEVIADCPMHTVRMSG
jgi:ferredoxin